MFRQEAILIRSMSGGLFTATCLADREIEAVDTSRARAKKKLERKIMKSGDEFFERPGRTFASAQVESKKFSVQPMTIIRERRFPTGPQIDIAVHVIRALDTWDRLFGLLPEFNISFYCPKPEEFQNMFNETVRSVLATASTDRLISAWPTSVYELDWLNIRIRSKGNRKLSHPVQSLRQVAEPLAHRSPVFVPPNVRYELRRTLKSQLATENMLLIGASGVGKSTLLQSVAREIQRERKNEEAADKSRVSTPIFWFSSASRLIAGMRYLGQWEERIEQVIQELSVFNGVLVIDNLRDLLVTGGRAPQNSVAAFLIPYLRNTQLRLASEVTPLQLEYCQRHLPGLVDCLSLVRFEALDAASETDLINQVITHEFDKHKRTLSEGVSNTIVRLSRQYLTGYAPPSGSMRFVNHWQADAKQNESIGSLDSAIDAYAKWSSLPDRLLRDSVTLDRDQIVTELERTVVGQRTACIAAADVVTRLKSSLNTPNRPFGCMLLSGPTGVGKTQLAKSLANYLFGIDGEKSRLIRLDMSEYNSYAAGDRFLNKGDHEPADWIQKVREQPLQVVLFDEIEKASSEVFDILLSVLDEGRITDRFGNLTSFCSTIVLMTSNLGSNKRSMSGFDSQADVDFISEVRKAFRPEFFNRLDAVVAFNPLDAKMIESIARKELKETAHREGIKRWGLRLEFSERLVQHIAKVGFSPTLGARPLQRAVESVVISQLAKWLINEAPEFGKTLQLDWNPNTESLTIS
jgi:ATP-dependent Clp protease ATP-binding subunit ClpC